MQFNRFMSAAAIVLASGAAFAQSGSTVLGGPDVKQTETAQPGAERAERPVPFMAHVIALRMMGRDEALRPTPEQAEQIRALVDERTAEVREFVEAHKEELAALRQQAGLPDRPGPDEAPEGRPQRRGGEEGTPADRLRGRADRRGPQGEGMEHEGPMDGPMGGPPEQREPATPEQAAAREKLRALMESAADDKAYTQRLLGILTEPQKAGLAAAIEQGRERMQQRREDGQQPERRGRLRDRDGAEDGQGPQRIQRRQRPNDD
jgi:hypothetical protein